MSQVVGRNIVCVVDDDPAILKAVKRLLTAHEFYAELFASAEDFNDRADLGRAFCLVLDIHMGGMSGIELWRDLADRGISLPTIFISADDSDTTRKATTDIGCIAHLRKPFSAKSLIDAIGKAAEPSPAQ